MKLTGKQLADKAFLAASYLDEERRKAQATKSAKARHFHQTGEKLGTGLDARDRAAVRVGLGMGCKYITLAEKVAKGGIPELVNRAKFGEITLEHAAKVATLDHRAQRKLMALSPVELRVEMSRTISRSNAARRSRMPKNAALQHPGTPFVRKILSGLERTALVCAEEGVVSAHDIARKFMAGMDWDNMGLRTQLERALPVIEAIHELTQTLPVRTQ